MTFKKGNCYTAIAKAKDLVPGFSDALALFEERVVLNRLSKSPSSRNKPKFKAVQKEMGILVINPVEAYSSKENNITDRKQCPCCEKGRMEIILAFRANAPPRFRSCIIQKPAVLPAIS